MPNNSSGNPKPRRRFAHFERMASALAALILMIAPALAQKVPIVDEASKDPSLVKMRAELIAAAKAKDVKRALAHFDPKVNLSFGGQAGHAAFAKMVRADPALWDELLWVLEHGGRFEKNRAEFAAPYTWNVELGKIDTFEAYVVIGKNIAAHAAPNAQSAVVARLGDEVVKVVADANSRRASGPFFRRAGWSKIELADKRTAYMEQKYLRSAIDHRAIFAKKGGAWKITVFIAGD